MTSDLGIGCLWLPGDGMRRLWLLVLTIFIQGLQVFSPHPKSNITTDGSLLKPKNLSSASNKVDLRLYVTGR